MGVPGERRVAPGARASGLRANLGGQLARADAAGHQASRELAEWEEATLGITEGRDVRGIGKGLAADEVEVQPHLEVVLGEGERGRFRRRGKGHHQRCRTDHAHPRETDRHAIQGTAPAVSGLAKLPGRDPSMPIEDGGTYPVYIPGTDRHVGDVQMKIKDDEMARVEADIDVTSTGGVKVSA